ncbi:MAG: sigma-70 family RNA polymerase sigma factor [Planctomycetota bacterium]|nr:MAG: sigma-70 family RNA polymerase sigma factor [Planctomycetota bacterium]
MNDDPQNMPPTPAEQVQMLFVRNEGAIRAFVRALQPALADADDVLQETFLTVSRKAADFEPGTNFVAWACGIARLKVLENLRQKKRANVLSEAAINALADESPASDLTGLREEALSRCLEKLAPKSRELLWRRYSSRQDSDEMADGLGMTSTAVRVALSKARAFLRDCVSFELKKA